MKTAVLLVGLFLFPFTALANDPATQPAKQPVAEEKKKESDEKSKDDGRLISKTSGWGLGTLANVSAIYLNGDYNVFKAGLGAGISYKWTDLNIRERHPVELGVYVATQVENNVGDSSVIVHASIAGGFGFGLGYRWIKLGGDDKGLTGAPERKNFFLTVGFSPTNEN